MKPVIFSHIIAIVTVAISSLLICESASFAQSKTNASKLSLTKEEVEFLRKERLRIEGKPVSRFKGSWRLGLSGESFEENTDDAKYTTFVLGSRFIYKFTDFLDIKGSLGLNAISGRSQARFKDWNGEAASIRLSEMVIRLKPIRYIEVAAGAINQEYLQAPSLLTASRSFPGVSEKIQYRNKLINVSIKAQQTIPTSSSLNDRREEKEATPTFTSETLTLGLGNEKFLYGEVNTTHFRFENLPSTVAYESRLLGNTVINELESNSFFEYGFDGIIAGGEASLKPNDNFKLRGFGYMVENNQADSAFNRGQYYGGEIKIYAGPAIIKPHMTYFFQESDVFPAYYSNGSMGNMNREGTATGLELIFRNWNFKISASYIESIEINDTVAQDDLTYYVLKLESLYVEF